MTMPNNDEKTIPKKRVNSRRKGKTGELEFARALTDLGFPARRGQQFRGGGESPDVVCESLPGIHWEVKRTATCGMHQPAQLLQWENQARRDAPEGALPAVAHRWNGARAWWVLLCGRQGTYCWMLLEDFVVWRWFWMAALAHSMDGEGYPGMPAPLFEESQP